MRDGGDASGRIFRTNLSEVCIASTSFASETGGASTGDRFYRLPPLLGNPLTAFLSCKLLRDVPASPEPLFPAGDVYGTHWATGAISYQKCFDKSMPVSQRLGHYLTRHRCGDWGYLPAANFGRNDRACSTGVGRVISCFMLETRDVPYFCGAPLTPLVLLSDLDYGLTVAFAVTHVELRHLLE